MISPTPAVQRTSNISTTLVYVALSCVGLLALGLVIGPIGGWTIHDATGATIASKTYTQLTWPGRGVVVLIAQLVMSFFIVRRVLTGFRFERVLVTSIILFGLNIYNCATVNSSLKDSAQAASGVGANVSTSLGWGWILTIGAPALLALVCLYGIHLRNQARNATAPAAQNEYGVAA